VSVASFSCFFPSPDCFIRFCLPGVQFGVTVFRFILCLPRNSVALSSLPRCCPIIVTSLKWPDLPDVVRVCCPSLTDFPDVGVCCRSLTDFPDVGVCCPSLTDFPDVGVCCPSLLDLPDVAVGDGIGQTFHHRCSPRSSLSEGSSRRRNEQAHGKKLRLMEMEKRILKMPWKESSFFTMDLKTHRTFSYSTISALRFCIDVSQISFM